MSSEEEKEVKRTSPFAAPHEVVEEGALEIDEGVVQRSASIDPSFVLSFDAVEREGVEFVRRVFEQLGGEVNSATEPVFDVDEEREDTFVDVVGGGQSDEGGECEGFNFADAPTRANPFRRVWSVHVNYHCVSLHSLAFPIGVLKTPSKFSINLLKARDSNMKMASWGCCVLVFDSSGKPATPPRDAFACFPVIPEVTLRLGVRHPAIKYPALYRDFPCVVHQVYNNKFFVLAMFGICYMCSNIQALVKLP